MFKLLHRKPPYARMFLISILFTFFCYRAHSQASYHKNEVSVHVNRALLGSGDHRAFLYQTKYTRHLNKFFALSADAGFLSSAHDWNSQYSTKVHINSYYMLNLTGSVAPIILQKHIIRLGGGGSYAYRTEVNPSMGSTYSGSPFQGRYYVSEDKSDAAGGGFGRQHIAGWHTQLGYTYLVTKNLAAGISLQLIYYMDSDIVNSAGLHAGYRF